MYVCEHHAAVRTRENANTITAGNFGLLLKLHKLTQFSKLETGGKAQKTRWQRLFIQIKCLEHLWANDTTGCNLWPFFAGRKTFKLCFFLNVCILSCVATLLELSAWLYFLGTATFLSFSGSLMRWWGLFSVHQPRTSERQQTCPHGILLLSLIGLK